MSRLRNAFLSTKNLGFSVGKRDHHERRNSWLISSNEDVSFTRATTITGGEEPGRLLRRPRQKRSNSRQTVTVGTCTNERASLPTRDKLLHDASLCVLTDQIVYEERLSNVDTTPVASLTFEQLVAHDVVGSVYLHVEEAVNRLVLETLTADQEGVDNCLSTDLEILVVRPVNVLLNGPVFKSQCFDDVIDKPGFVTRLGALVKSKNQQLVAKQIEIENRCRKFV